MYKIAIPSYNRVDILGKKTLDTLQRFNIAKESIYIFVIEEEYDDYFSRYSEYKIIIGVKGLINQRRFIEKYFKEGEKVIMCDDDITDFDFKGKTLNDFIHEAFDICLSNKAFIFSIYPVWNPFYRQKQKYITTDLRFIHGGFYGIINRHCMDYTLPNDMKEDVERTLQYWIKDGVVVRFNQYGFKSKMYSTGGCGGFNERLSLNEESTNHLVDKYSEYGKRKIRKNGMHEFQLNYKVKPKIGYTEGTVGRTAVFEKLEQLLQKYKIPWKSAAGYDKNGRSTNGRRGFPKYRGCVYGLTKQKIGGKIDLSYQSKKHSEVYDELVRVGKIICPFEFTSIQVNNNLVCPKHVDSNNVGDSLLVSIGDYEGCNIVVNGVEYNTKYNPIIFNGGKLEHWNTPLISGNKYSLVFFSIKCALSI